MLTLIARGYNTLLSRQRGEFTPLALRGQMPRRLPRDPGRRLHVPSGRAIAAVLRHRRP